MRVMLLIFLFLGVLANIYADTPSHCSKMEKIIFSCQMNKSSKVLSLCASKDISNSSGYLQYRYGRLNKVELEFPGVRENSQKQFLYRHFFRYQVDRTEIAFVNHGHEYTIYSYYEGDGEGAPIEEEGVRVDNVNLLCKHPTTADFTPLESAVPCDEESALGC